MALVKRSELSNWFKFCKEKIERIEKVWNRKLDEKHQEEEEEELNNKDDDEFENDFENNLRKADEESEKQIETLLTSITNRRRDNVAHVKS